MEKLKELIKFPEIFFERVLRGIQKLKYKKMVKRFFSICDGILMYCEWWVIPGVLEKRILRLQYQSFWQSGDERFKEKPCCVCFFFFFFFFFFSFFFTEYGQRNRRKCKILKGSSSVIYPIAKDGQALVKAAYRFCRSNEGTKLLHSGWLFLKMDRIMGYNSQ